MEGTIGEVRMFAGNFAPRTWAFCNGQLLAINSNQALFSILGTTYGGDGRTSFGLPDLRGRVPISPGTGPGLSNYRLGTRGGVETVTLNQTQIPSHNHSGQVSLQAKTPLGRGEGTTTPTNAYLAEGGSYATGSNVTMAPNSVTIGNAGGNLAHENRPPFLSLYYIICLQGIFPSRS